jgi:hypothetical protein
VRRDATMTEPNNQFPTDNENEQTSNSLRNEIAGLKSRLTKKEDRIATLDVMLNQIMESQHAEVRAYEDLEKEETFFPSELTNYTGALPHL